MSEIKISEITIPAVQVMNPEPTKRMSLPISGKLITSQNQVAIGINNFQELTNMRYTDKGPKSIAGMTALNDTLGTYYKPRAAFHFRKPGVSSTENHLMLQAFNTGLTASEVLDMTSAPPAAGNFSTTLFSDSAGAGVGRFTDAPNSCIAYAKGVDTCIWGGNEMPAGAFIVSTAVDRRRGRRLVRAGAKRPTRRACGRASGPSQRRASCPPA